MNMNRRHFLQKSSLSTLAAAAPAVLGTTAASRAKVPGANDRIRVGIAGFSDRFKSSLSKAFGSLSKQHNCEFVGLSDIWNRRRDEGTDYIKKLTGQEITTYRNNEEMYEKAKLDAVIISTADFQHALHLAQGIDAGCDVYCEKPFAETMADARVALKTANASDRVVQIGSQRRSAGAYHAAKDYLDSGKFGDIVCVEMTWNVNQPGRWRRESLTSSIKESDVDWERYQMNRPKAAWDPRKYLEYRLFWPYSSGIAGQWMCHQIDTVHWFSGLPHPRSVSGNGGIYLWKDGRTNFDTLTAVFDYGPLDDPSKGFQVIYSSRFTNSAGGTKEIYYSNGGELNLATRKVSDNGGLSESHAKAMGMKENKLKGQELKGEAVVTSANTGADPMTNAHMNNWLECLRSRKKTHAPVEAGYQHAIACIMANAAVRTGTKVTFDEEKQEVMAGGKVFQY